MLPAEAKCREKGCDWHSFDLPEEVFKKAESHVTKTGHTILMKTRRPEAGGDSVTDGWITIGPAKKEEGEG